MKIETILIALLFPKEKNIMTKKYLRVSGVDVEAGYEVVARIKKHVAARAPERLGVMGALGGLVGCLTCLSARRERTCFDFRN